MRFLPLLWSNLTRKRARAAFTFLAIAAAFVLFGLLMAVKAAFSSRASLAGDDRLVMRHKVSLIQPLPESYQERLERIPGVVAVAHASFLGGIYQDPKNNFRQVAVEPERFLPLHPELVLSEEEKEAWMRTKTGAIVGRDLADRFGWKVGDRIPLQGTFNRKKEGPNVWELDIVGIYDGAERGTDTNRLFLRWDYLEDSRVGGQGLVGFYVIRIDDPSRAAELCKVIDQTFANSFYETKTTPEKAFVAAFADQIGDTGAIVAVIVGLVFFTMLLVTGNTMAQTVRERTSELAVLKTLGFSDRRVLALVLAESLTLAAAGGGVGLLVAWLFILRGDPTRGLLPTFYLPASDLLLGAGFVVLLGLAAGLVPALEARRLRIADALRRA